MWISCGKIERAHEDLFPWLKNHSVDNPSLVSCELRLYEPQAKQTNIMINNDKFLNTLKGL